jgi:hypothetical protein
MSREKEHSEEDDRKLPKDPPPDRDAQRRLPPMPKPG